MTLADEILKHGGAGDEVGGDCREPKQNSRRRKAQRQMAKEESAQATALAARRRLGRETVDRGRSKWAGGRSFALT